MNHFLICLRICVIQVLFIAPFKSNNQHCDSVSSRHSDINPVKVNNGLHQMALVKTNWLASTTAYPLQRVTEWQHLCAAAGEGPTFGQIGLNIEIEIFFLKWIDR